MGFGRSGCCFHTLLQDVCDGGKSQRPARDLAVAAKSLQSCPTLCDPIDGSSPGSPVPGILQARVLEWGAIAETFRCTVISGEKN